MLRSATALILVTLMVFAFSGYLGVFKLRQFQIRMEVKTLLKTGAPDSLKYQFYLDELAAAGNGIQWMHSEEFRYRGDMYDVIARTEIDGRTVLHCVKDVKESGLFAELDRIVALKMNVDPNNKRAQNYWQKLLNTPFVNASTADTFLPPTAKTAHRTPYTAHSIQVYYPPFSPPPQFPG